MLENKFKTELIKKIKTLLPESFVFHLDPTELQGAPDLIVINGPKWGMLEGKKTAGASHRPNQDFYVDLFNKMSFASFISPETQEEVLNGLLQALKS